MTTLLDHTRLDGAGLDHTAHRSECARHETIPPLAEVVRACAPVPGGERPYVDFDCAASAPATVAVTRRITELLPTYASVHRGAGHPSAVSTEAYESARRTVAEFVGARPGDVVVFTRNTTDALNLLAGCVPGEVVLLDIEHHANLLAWRNSRVVPAADTVDETVRRVVAELCSRPTALLAVTGASNVTGETVPIERLADVAHRLGARIAVDAAQLAPHRALDIAASGVDYVAFSGHKLYAPFGAGALVGRRDWLDAAPPHLAGGGATRDVQVDGTSGAPSIRTTWQPSPARHEGGTPNLLGSAALAAACEELSGIGFDAIREHETRLCERLLHGLRRIDGVRVHRLWHDAPDTVGIATFTVDGAAPRAVAEHLSEQHAVGVRDGRFCAHPLLDRLGLQGGAVRASLGLGTSSDDVDALLDAVADFVATRRGRRG
ncbi:aminotransferase class V-fold PLP-dependent enzyme [Rhodococcus rhodnii]|uniref:Cysteine desulfurase n=2 Tax=Rhodococcus rhodnii TaxID=38312 RepID=R7WVW3_9NOCA|nr:aminotransferase class V-fold PLP-dependent enzyme [Rhodococcus rhodnii]EOM78289.1 cysteine desulfurase [Rhodococcus rhodnii LMG 5362]TXG89292.1 aminotransferase class V-fold PLP-dependent enzyme [Rhodococcus rhodnii]